MSLHKSFHRLVIVDQPCRRVLSNLMTQEGVKGGKAGSGVFVSHPCVVENQHLDSTGSIALCKSLEVFRMFWIWLKGHRTNLLVLPVLRLSKVFGVEGEDWSQGEEVGLIKLPDLQATV